MELRIIFTVFYIRLAVSTFLYVVLSMDPIVCRAAKSPWRDPGWLIIDPPLPIKNNKIKINRPHHQCFCIYQKINGVFLGRKVEILRMKINKKKLLIF